MIKRRLLILIKAMGMGVADLIPGVSGGTIAFITGIYERFIGALSRVDHKAVKFFFTGQFRKLMQRIDGWFLITLITGILISVLSLARIIGYLLEEHPEPLWAFFFGLILASIGLVSLRVKNWRPLLFLWMAAGGIIAWYITNSPIVQTPNTAPYIFGAGFISISAMILPGISGSYILVILDKYDFFIGVMSALSVSIQGFAGSMLSGDWQGIVNAVRESRLDDLLIFYAGTVTGIITFAKVLNWLFHRFHDHAIAILTGFMAGSLFKVWPWKVTIETYINRHGEEKPLIEHNILPSFDSEATWLAIAFMVFGTLLVIVLNNLAKEKKEKKSKDLTSI